MREVLKPLYMKEGRAQQNGVCSPSFFFISHKAVKIPFFVSIR